MSYTTAYVAPSGANASVEPAAYGLVLECWMSPALWVGVEIADDLIDADYDAPDPEVDWLGGWSVVLCVPADLMASVDRGEGCGVGAVVDLLDPAELSALSVLIEAALADRLDKLDVRMAEEVPF